MERALPEATVTKRRLGERRDTTLGRVGVDVDFTTCAADANALLAELRRGGLGKAERVDRLPARLVAPAFDPRRGAELVEQLRELTRRGVDHLHVALLRLAEGAHPNHPLREAGDRPQRRTQLVGGGRGRLEAARGRFGP